MRTFAYIVTAGVLAAVLLSGCNDRGGQSDQEPQSDIGKLQGAWQVVSAERMGNPMSDFEKMKLVIEGATMTFKREDEVLFNGKITLDPFKQPKTLDMELIEDAQGHHQGEVSPGIYAIEGDTLKWCNASPGDFDGPREFSTNKEKNHMLLVLKREKK
jgi:uncharacterized protein (TIGR03067 family)